NFAEQLHLKVIGIVENMSGFSCPHCGTVTNIFKTGGAEALAKELNIEFLGKIPIYPEIVQHADTGVPAVESSEEVRKIYNEISSRIASLVEK
ncbi:binding protein, partial [mine drainage metagenome]